MPLRPTAHQVLAAYVDSSRTEYTKAKSIRSVYTAYNCYILLAILMLTPSPLALC